MSSSSNQSSPQTRVVADQGGHVLYTPTPAEKRTGHIMGAWFLGTFVFSIPAFWFYDPLLNHGELCARQRTRHPGRHRGPAGDLLDDLRHRHRSRDLSDLKRVNESTALGYVASRTVESILILVGVLSLMTIVTLRQDLASGRADLALLDDARSLLALHDQVALLLGPQFCAGLGNGILLGYLMWRSRLLPRPMVWFGLIGGPLALLAGIGVLLGVWGIHSGLPVLMTAPEAIWEFSLSVWLLFKSFQPSPILSGDPSPIVA